MRAIFDHVVEGDLPQNQLRIEVMDEPGAGGANHRYEVIVPTWGCPTHYHINFQNGPIQEAGVNGITQEVLLAIVIDRLRSFQAGPYPSPENKMALSFCELALGQLQARTKDRLSRAVEGKTQA